MKALPERGFRLLYLLAPAILLLKLATVHASSSDIHNGYWWRDEDVRYKQGYIAGFVGGSESAREWFRYAQRSSKTKIDSAKFDVVISSVNYTEITFGQFYEGLAKFYEDFKNVGIHIDEAMDYVKDQIRGEDQKYLDKRLQSLRKEASSPDYDK